VDFHRIGAQRGLDASGNGHTIALEINEQTLLRDGRRAKNSVCASHHRRPYHGQSGAFNRQIAGLQPVNRHEGHLGSARDAVKNDRGHFRGLEPERARESGRNSRMVGAGIDDESEGTPAIDHHRHHDPPNVVTRRRRREQRIAPERRNRSRFHRFGQHRIQGCRSPRGFGRGSPKQRPQQAHIAP
jgi:hypothetical protein